MSALNFYNLLRVRAKAKSPAHDQLFVDMIRLFFFLEYDFFRPTFSQFAQENSLALTRLSSVQLLALLGLAGGAWQLNAIQALQQRGASVI